MNSYDITNIINNRILFRAMLIPIVPIIKLPTIIDIVHYLAITRQRDNLIRFINSIKDEDKRLEVITFVLLLGPQYDYVKEAVVHYSHNHYKDTDITRDPETNDLKVHSAVVKPLYDRHFKRKTRRYPDGIYRREHHKNKLPCLHLIDDDTKKSIYANCKSHIVKTAVNDTLNEALGSDQGYNKGGDEGGIEAVIDFIKRNTPDGSKSKVTFKDNDKDEDGIEDVIEFINENTPVGTNSKVTSEYENEWSFDSEVTSEDENEWSFADEKKWE